MKKLKTTTTITVAAALGYSLVRIYQTESGFAGDAFLKGVMEEIEKRSAELTGAINQNKVLSGLENADVECDEAVKILGTVLAGYSVFPVESKKAAGEKLLAIFNKYGYKITRANYASESSLIESLLEDFSQEEAKANVKELDGIAQILENIRTAQEAFAQANDVYTAGTAVKTECATSIKKTLVLIINDKLLPYLSAMRLVNADMYENFSAKVEREISRINETGRKRGTLSASVMAGSNEKIPE